MSISVCTLGNCLIWSVNSVLYIEKVQSIYMVNLHRNQKVPDLDCWYRMKLNHARACTELGPTTTNVCVRTCTHSRHRYWLCKCQHGVVAFEGSCARQPGVGKKGMGLTTYILKNIEFKCILMCLC